MEKGTTRRVTTNPLLKLSPLPVGRPAGGVLAPVAPVLHAPDARVGVGLLGGVLVVVGRVVGHLVVPRRLAVAAAAAAAAVCGGHSALLEVVEALVGLIAVSCSSGPGRWGHYTWGATVY